MTPRIMIPAAVILFIGGAAVAVTAGGGHRGDHKAHHEARLDRMFETFDLNADGVIEQAEITANRETRFSASDTNGDGTLTEGEIRAAIVKRAEARADRMVERIMERSDADKNGAVSLAEFRDTPNRRAAKMIKHLDTDGDGAITRAEAEAAKGWRHGRGHDKKAE